MGKGSGGGGGGSGGRAGGGVPNTPSGFTSDHQDDDLMFETPSSSGRGATIRRIEAGEPWTLATYRGPARNRARRFSPVSSFSNAVKQARSWIDNSER